MQGLSALEGTYSGREQKIDNLRAAVTRAAWYDPELNPKLIAFAEHYQTVILPTKSYTPRHKEKVSYCAS